jgi:DNA invertase Pin-like site-specific DNA recombinase
MSDTGDRSVPQSNPARLYRFVLYARKSTDREDKQIQSIDDQIRLATERAAREGLAIVHTLVESRSAKRPDSRPGFAEMIRLLEKGKADAVITWHPDRLARNAVDGGWVLDLLDRGKLRHIVFASGYQFDNTPEGKMMLSLVFSQAKYQVDKLSVDVSRGMSSKRERGGFPHRAPEGYVNDRNSRSVAPDPLRFPLLRRAIELIMNEQSSVSDALTALNDRWGYRTKPTKRNAGLGSPLSRATFYGILNNPFYAGLCRGPKGLYKGDHRPLLTAEEFQRIRSLHGRDRLSTAEPNGEEGTITRKQKHVFAFTGLMRCGRCGCQITATRSKGYTYYHCTNMRKVCDRRGVREELLVAQVSRYLRTVTIPEDVESSLHSTIERYLNQTRREHSRVAITSQEESAKVIAQNRARLAKLLDMRLSDMVTDEEYLSRKATLATEIESLKQQASLRGVENEEAGSVLANTRLAASFCARAEQHFKIAEPLVKRLTVRTLAAEGKMTILTGGKLLLEPKPIFRRMSVLSRKIRVFEPAINGSGKSKQTTREREVCFGGPDEVTFKLIPNLLETVRGLTPQALGDLAHLSQVVEREGSPEGSTGEEER